MTPSPRFFVVIFQGPVPPAVSQTINSHKLTDQSVLLGGRNSFEEAANELRAIAPEASPWIFTASTAPVRLH